MKGESRIGKKKSKRPSLARVVVFYVEERIWKEAREKEGASERKRKLKLFFI